jgi:phenylacetate-CoA ligase
VLPGDDRRANVRRSVEGLVSRATREAVARIMARELERVERMDEKEIAHLQRRRTAQAIVRAVAHTAYYGALAAELGVDARALREHGALARFPLTDKATLIARRGDFRDRRYPPLMLRRGYSSGTSGTPVMVYRDPLSIAVEHAFVHRQWRWAGVQVEDRCVVLRGALLFDAARTEPPFWQYNAPERQLLMSSYHLSERTAGAYYRAIAAFRPRAIQAYPSSVYLLSRLLGPARCSKLGIRAIFTSSEMLIPAWREVVERAFGCRIFDYYGNAERTAAIGSCEEGTYHIYPDYGLTEVIPVGGIDQSGRIVGTPFHARVMPLIRYDSKDVATPTARRCSCGRAFPVVETLEGRWDDFVVTSDARYIGRLDHVFKGLHGIVEAQIVQTDVRQLAVFVVRGREYAPATEEALRKNLKGRTSQDMEVEVVHVDAIPRGAHGKFRAVVSTVPR